MNSSVVEVFKKVISSNCLLCWEKWPCLCDIRSSRSDGMKMRA